MCFDWLSSGLSHSSAIQFDWGFDRFGQIFRWNSSFASVRATAAHQTSNCENLFENRRFFFLFFFSFCCVPVTRFPIAVISFWKRVNYVEPVTKWKIRFWTISGSLTLLRSWPGKWPEKCFGALTSIDCFTALETTSNEKRFLMQKQKQTGNDTAANFKKR